MAETPKTVDRYALNSFYQFSEYEGGLFSSGEEQTVMPGDNPPFVYPPRYLRNSATGTSVKLQRGYLRMVLPKGKNLPNSALERKRLHFQFNPDSITRSVTARNDIQMWMNQSPEQLTQPIPGDSNFGFQLLFNREPDVYSGTFSPDGTYSTKIVVDAGQGSQELSVSENASSDNFIDFTSATDIGVLADIMVMDSIIGQGINSDMVDYLKDRAERYRKYSQAKYDLTYAGAEEAPPRPEDFDTKAAGEILNANFGNSAFLISNPIRIVFSSLFMVEGYVTNTEVVFNKFSPTMVPVQAIVNVTMQALYIGHAKKDTFLTKAYEIADQVIDQTLSLQEQEVERVQDLGKDLFLYIEESDDNNYIGLADFGFGSSATDDDEGTDFKEKVAIRFKASDQLEENIKNGTIKDITAKFVYTIEYLGKKVSKTGQYHKPKAYENLATVVSASSDSNFNKGDLHDDEGDTRNITLKTASITNASSYVDEDNDSFYKHTFIGEFDVATEIGGAVRAPQQVYGEWTLNYEDSRYLRLWGNKDSDPVDLPPIALRQRPEETDG